MPGPAVHYLIGQLLSNSSKVYQPYAGFNPSYYLDESTRSILKEFPDYLSVGTLGPDFLFFNTKDWPGGEHLPVRLMVKAAKTLASLEHEIEKSYPLLVEIHELKKELEEEVGEAVDDIVESSPTLSAIRLLFRDLNAIMELISAIISNGMKDLVTSNIDIFGLLTHPIQDCDPKEDWWWFDILHYRKSGEFAKFLIDQSKSNPSHLAYSIGYMSHLTADTVGHPYVNTLVRGPYRNHSQRHKVVENFQDVSAYARFKSSLGLGDKEFVSGDLHEKFLFRDGRRSVFTGEVLKETESLIDGLTPGFADIGMPEELAALFSRATEEVYTTSGKHLFGGGMKPEEVDSAYRLWYAWFKSTTSETVLPKQLPELPPLSEELREAWNRFRDRVNNALNELGNAIEDLFTGNPGSSFSWENVINFFKKIGRVIKAAVAAAVAMGSVAEEIIATITSHTAHFILDQIYQALYTAYDYFRLSVALNGFAFPFESHLNDYKVQHMLNPILSDSNNNRVSPSWPYPVQKLKVSDGIFRFAPQEAHLVYPVTDPEFNQVPVGPDSYTNQSHDYFINKPIHMDNSVASNLGNASYMAANPDIMKQETLGNALDLTAFYWNAVKSGQKLPDLNLDGDRGMAHPSWEIENCQPEMGTTASKPIIESYTD